MHPPFFFPPNAVLFVPVQMAAAMMLPLDEIAEIDCVACARKCTDMEHSYCLWMSENRSATFFCPRHIPWGFMAAERHPFVA